MMSSTFMIWLLALLGGVDSVGSLDRATYWQTYQVTPDIVNMSQMLEVADAPKPDAKPWLAKLGADDAADRAEAVTQLRKMGPAILPDLEPLSKSADPEIAQAAKALSAELHALPSAEDDHMLRLMAIQELGYLDDMKALPTLEALTKSTAPFEADYARQAIARINGDDDTTLHASDLPGPDATDAMIAKLPSLPGMPLTAVIRLRSDAGIAAAMIAPDDAAAPNPLGAMSMDAMRAAITAKSMESLSVLGNIRIDGIVIGMSDPTALPGATGEPAGKRAATLIITAKLDVDALFVMLKESGNEKTREINIETYRVLETGVPGVSYLAVLDETHFLVGYSEAAYPINDVLQGIRKGATLDATLPISTLLAKTPTVGPIRVAAMLPKQNLLAAPAFATFNAVNISTSIDPATPSLITYETRLFTTDPTLLQTANDELIAAIASARTSMVGPANDKRAAMRAMAMKPMIDAIDALHVEMEGDALLIKTAQSPKIFAALPMVMMRMMR